MADEAEDTSKPRVGAGNVMITLGGQEYPLVPTLAAAQAISREQGGIRTAIDRLAQMDFDLVCKVVRLGLGPKVVRELGGAEKIPELVYETGLIDSSGRAITKCIDYLTNLSNGGRPPPTNDGDEENPQ